MKPKQTKKKKVELLRELMADFKRMDLMLKSFQRIGHNERKWFISRLQADHRDLLKNEKANP